MNKSSQRDTDRRKFLLRALVAVVGFSLVAVLVLSGCGTSGSQSSPSPSASPAASPKASPSAPAASSAAPQASDEERLAKLYEAAKKEGQVLVYGQRGQQAEKLISEAWNQKYPGIKYEAVPSRGTEAVQKIATEQRTRNYTADILSIGASGVWQAKKETLLEKWVPPGLPAKGVEYARDPLEPDGYGMIDGILIYGILINTDLIKPGNEPKSWADIADPKYKGLVMLDNPVGISPGNNWFVVMSKTLGKEYLEKLSKNEVTVSRQSTPEGVKVLARGEAGIMVPLSVGNIVTLPAGSPVKWIHPSDGAVLSYRALSLVKNAPHPNAAKLFMEWVASKDAQDALSRAGEVSPRLDAPAAIPEMDLKGKKTLPSQTEADLEKNAEYAKEAERLFVQ